MSFAREATIAPQMDSPQGPAVPHDDGVVRQRRRSRSPGTRTSLASKRPSAQRIPEYAHNEVIQTYEKRFSQEHITVSPRTSSADVGLRQSEYRYFLEMYFWMLVRTVLFVGSAILFPTYISLPIITGLVLLYFDIYLPISHPNRLSKWSLVFSLFVLTLILSVKYAELRPTYEPTLTIKPQFTQTEREALENRLRQHANTQVSNQVALISQKIANLHASGGQPITTELIDQAIKNQLQEFSKDLTSQQKQQIQTIVLDYMNANRSPSSGGGISEAQITQIVQQQIEATRRHLTSEIHSVRDLISSISRESLESVVSGWVKDEVKQARIYSEIPTTPSGAKLHQEVQGWNLPSDQDASIKQIITRSLDQYVSLYSKLVGPEISISPKPESRPGANADLLGVHQFGTWIVRRDDAELPEFELKTSEPIHPYLLIITLNHGKSKNQADAHFLCPPENFVLSCADSFGSGSLVGSGALNLNDPPIPVQDFDLTPTRSCSTFKLKVKPSSSEECAHGAGYTRAHFKVRLFGFK